MNRYMNAYKELASFLTEEEILLEEPMKNHTWFKIGGIADILLRPESVEKLIKVIHYVNKNSIPTFLIGNGSNLLVRDGGIRGIVIKTEQIKNISIEGNILSAECGAELADISTAAYNASLTGFEFACGIPGTLGGAVYMNAGAYDGEMSFVLDEVRVVTMDLKVITLKREDLELGYRTSAVKTNGYVVLDAKIILEPGAKEEIKGKIDDLTHKREDRQPLEFPSAGSTFKRPTGYFAGKLIQDAGLKGYQIGGAQVSEKHSGFVINKENAKADDVLGLIQYIQNTVMEKFNVELSTEVLIVGEDLAEL
ncbi:MAG: UDP-N-acetylmuramate dehydrogenase [Clostridium sp.]|jgi:UDP-N-acetylmuramate dehydrogenase|nr:UDP-N-acetylmuramate dehydrogenase [Clostridium sp.]